MQEEHQLGNSGPGLGSWGSSWRAGGSPGGTSSTSSTYMMAAKRMDAKKRRFWRSGVLKGAPM